MLNVQCVVCRVSKISKQYLFIVEEDLRPEKNPKNGAPEKSAWGD